MSFRYYNPVEICFDIGYKKALEEIAQMPYRGFILITSQSWKKRGICDTIKEILQTKLLHTIDTICTNPQLETLQALKDSMPHFDKSAIIAFGGGSVLDSAKFFALDARILPQNGKLEILDYRGAMDIFAFPTTAGTSSELTKWATIWDKNAHIKYSLNYPQAYAKKAFYDCELLCSLPRDMTIYTALDSLSHAIESIWNANASALTITYAQNAIELICANLAPLSENLASLPLRKYIALGSIYAGLAFSNTQTALAHAISYPITMRYDVPHGLACSFCLPLLLECLRESAESSAPNIADKSRLYHANEILAPYLPDIQALFQTLQISSNPKDYGLDSSFIEEIFGTLNERAKNCLLDTSSVKKRLLHSAI